MRAFRPLTALLLALAAAAPSWAALAHVEPLPQAPTPIAPVAAMTAPIPGSPLATLLTALAPVLSPAPLPTVPTAPAPEALTAPAAPKAAPAPGVLPAVRFEQDRDGRPSAVLVLKTGAARLERAPEDSGRLFDAAPAAPDFGALTPVRVPAAPEKWTPRSLLLKPVAAAVNAWSAARYQRRLDNPRPGERVTSEERGLRDSLTSIHAAISDGRLQDAVSIVAEHFQTRRAYSWYRENSQYAPYRARAFADMRFVEAAVKLAYERAGSRGLDPFLVAEARAAERDGTALGRGWRATPIQEKDSGHCAQNALFNAIMAAAGFTRPTTAAEFVAASRALLNRPTSLKPSISKAAAVELERYYGVSFGRRDVGEGMDSASFREWAAALGLKAGTVPAPRGDAGWSALFAPGRENLLTMRLFHRRYPHDDEEVDRLGHVYRALHHQAYLLGAFDSPSRGRRLYLIQDSGSGATLMATAEELAAMTRTVETLDIPGPVSLPAAR